MFDNIGGKIKKLAQVICWIGIVFSVISGIVLMVNGGNGILTGLFTIIAGCLASWISSFFAYGFGQLIENTDAIRYNTEKKD